MNTIHYGTLPAHSLSLALWVNLVTFFESLKVPSIRLVISTNESRVGTESREGIGMGGRSGERLTK